MDVFFVHGEESEQEERKIVALGRIAKVMGLGVYRSDFTALRKPEHRVRKLLWSLDDPGEELILVGSGMDGYVMTIASKLIQPAGLFLMAPTFYISGNEQCDPIPHAGRTVLVHGLGDDLVPPENAARFARRHGAELHLLTAGHALTEAMDQVEKIFTGFLLSVIREKVRASPPQDEAT